MKKLFTSSLTLLILCFSGVAWGQTNNYFGTEGDLNGNKWSTNPAGPYNQAFNTTGGGIMNFDNAVPTTKWAGAITVAGINVNANFSIGSSVAGASIQAYNSGIVPIFVASGVTANWGPYPFSSGVATAGYTKNGGGTLVTAGGTYGGGFTLNEGTLVAPNGGPALNAMGGGATNTLTINGGTIAAVAARDFSGKYPGGITIGGNFTLGSSTAPAVGSSNLTFSNNVSLGSNATRTITIGGTGTYTFSGAIGGDGSGITVAATEAGKLLLTGGNTYTGLTTVNGGTLELNRTGGNTLPATNNVVVNGGTLTISKNQTLNDLTLNGGTLSIASGVTLTVTGTYALNGGTVSGAGSLVVEPTATLSTSLVTGLPTGCACSPSGSYLFNGTEDQVTGPGLPASVAGLTINSTGNLTLTNPVTVNTLTLTQGKLTLGDHTLTVINLVGGGSNSYVVTDGVGALKMPVEAGQPKDFPVGASTSSYDPVTINPASSTDFEVEVKATATAADFPGAISNYSKVAKRKWRITPTAAPGATVLKLRNGGTKIVPVNPKMGHFKTATNTWEELSATFNTTDDTWTATATDFSPFGVGDQGGFAAPLPISLLFFEAAKKGQEALLTWRTASEENNDYMAVERSSNGFDFREIGRVNGAGNSTSFRDYNFTDSRPLKGINYYRLRQVDYDGTSEYHKIVALQFNDESGDVFLLPTAVADQFDVVFTAPLETKVLLEIYSLSGHLLLSESIASGSQTKVVHVADMHPGIYLVRLGTGTAVITKRFVKL